MTTADPEIEILMDAIEAGKITSYNQRLAIIQDFINEECKFIEEEGGDDHFKFVGYIYALMLVCNRFKKIASGES